VVSERNQAGYLSPENTLREGQKSRQLRVKIKKRGKAKSDGKF